MDDHEDDHQDDESTDGIPDPDDRSEEAEHPDLTSAILDDTFVAGATIHEPSASERLDRTGPYGMPSGTPGGLPGFEPTRVFITTSRSGDSGRGASSTDPFDESGFDPDGPHHDHLDDDQVFHERSMRRRRRRRRTVRALALLVVLATFAVYGLDHFVTGVQLLPWTRMNRALSGNEAPEGDTAITPPAEEEPPEPIDPTPEADSQVRIIRGENWPPAPQEPSTERVLPPVVATTSGPHDFIMLQDDGSAPVAYDPCRPIPYVVSGASKAPLEARQLLDEAIAAVSGATGLAFLDEGTTTERPSDQRRSYQPHRYGPRWAPVLIAWSDPTESPRLSEGPSEFDTTELDILGYAGSNAVGLRTIQKDSQGGADAAGDTAADGAPTGDASGGASGGADADDRAPLDQMIYVTGTVTLDGPDFVSLLQTPGGYETARAALMHELAHLVGLAHIDDRTQLMYPSLQPHVTTFAGGDLEGLATLGSGQCRPEI